MSDGYIVLIWGNDGEVRHSGYFENLSVASRQLSQWWFNANYHADLGDYAIFEANKLEVHVEPSGNVALG